MDRKDFRINAEYNFDFLAVPGLEFSMLKFHELATVQVQYVVIFNLIQNTHKCIKNFYQFNIDNV